MSWKKTILGSARTIVDSSRCMAHSSVAVVRYSGVPKPGDPTIYTVKAVHPHPRFLIVDDTRSKGLFREADLAVVHLETPVKERFRPIKLPAAEVRPSEPLIMVGYGLGETEYPKTEFGYRHFGESKVAQIDRLASGGMRFSALDHPADGTTPSTVQLGDSGGAGFSKADDTVLLGIVSSRSEERGSILESVYPYSKWLQEELNQGQ